MDTRLLVDSCWVLRLLNMFLSPSQQWGHLTGQCILYGTVEYNTFGLVLETISVSVAIWLYTSCVEEKVKRERLWLNVTLGVCVKILFLLAVSGTASFCLPFKAYPPITSHILYSSSVLYFVLSQKSVWVNFFFWVLIVAVVFVQKHQRSGSEWSTSETEPFFHRPV
uniref:Uncharacterized protein n=1 Tax=Salmo trutta TaxID=8032 RepID=A0A674ASS7_SALTR